MNRITRGACYERGRKFLALTLTLLLLVFLAAVLRGQSALDGLEPAQPTPIPATLRQDGFFPSLLEGAPLVTVSLPIENFDTSVPITTILVRPVTTTLIDPTTTGGTNYVGFQGDFTFDTAVVSFPATGQVQRAGLTTGDWGVSSAIIAGPAPTPGTLKILRISAFSNNFTPLNGSGVLFNVRMLRVSNNPGDMSALIWRPDPAWFVFIDDDNFDAHVPNQPNGRIAIGAVCNLMEGFDDIATLVSSGWFMQNNSQPGPGTTGWFQGSPAAFTSHSGAPNSYIAADYNNGTGTSTLSNWFLTEPMTLRDEAQLSFWTRTADTPAYADRLQVRMSTNGTSSNVGSTATAIGDFTTLLLDINPTYTLTGYPNAWTQFTVTLSGLGSPTTGRLAFRYFVENGGPTGTNSEYIGIDTVEYACPIPTPAPPTPTPPPVPTPTPTPPPINISGTVSYCSNPVPGPVPDVTLTLTGSASSSTLSEGSGNYQFLSLASGGNYAVTPTKNTLTPGSSGINTVDVVAVKQHFLSIVPLPPGCRLTAADVTGNGAVDTVDVIAIQRFFLGFTTGIADVGKYQFSPTSRTYSGVGSNQTGQNYDTLIFGDVASHFAE